VFNYTAILKQIKVVAMAVSMIVIYILLKYCAKRKQESEKKLFSVRGVDTNKKGEEFYESFVSNEAF
jgi:hypothetical protein